MVTRCEFCALPVRGRRRDARYCSAAHRQAALRARTSRGAMSALTGHGGTVTTHLIGSSTPPERDGSTLRVVRRTADTRSSVLTPNGHNSSARKWPRDVRPAIRGQALTSRRPRATIAGPRTRGGQPIAAIVPAHDHDGRLCATCMTARVATMAPRAPHAKVDPLDVVNALEAHRGDVPRVARLFDISERHVRRIRAGYRPKGGVDAEAVASIIREDYGSLTRATLVFGISHRHALRIRQGWRPGGVQVPAIPWDSRSSSVHGRHGGEGAWQLDHVARSIGAARRATAEAAAKVAEVATVQEAAAQVRERAQAVRDRVVADLQEDPWAWTCRACGHEGNAPSRHGCASCGRAWDGYLPGAHRGSWS